MSLIAHALRWIAEALQRFVDGNPRDPYERAVFQAVRTIIITAFLKPFRETHGVTT